MGEFIQNKQDLEKVFLNLGLRLTIYQINCLVESIQTWLTEASKPK